MEFQTKKKYFYILILLLFITAIFSFTIFIPQVREIIIFIGEKLSGHSLKKEVWNPRLIKWEVELLCTFAVFLVLLCFPKKIKLTSESCFYISWTFIIVFSILLLLVSCQSNDLWLDETFSLGLARHRLNEIIKLTAEDVHPPLYYVILRIAMLLFPNSVRVARIVSIIPIILILFIANIFFLKEFTSKLSILFNSILLSTYSIYKYSLEIRMYSWCLFFCFLCCIFSYYIIKKSEWKYFFLYVLFAECGAYSQYWTAFGLAINFIIISVLCILKDKSNTKKVLVSALLGILLYLPWAKVVINQVSVVSSSYWISSPTLSTFIDYILSVMPGQSITKIILTLFIIYFIVECIKCITKKEKTIFYLFTISCLITPLVLILCATIISFLMRPVFIARYAFPFIVFVFFFFVLCIFNNKYYKKIITGFIFFSILFSFFNLYDSYESEKKMSKEYNFFEQIMNEKLTEKTVFIFSENINRHIPYCIAYRYPNIKIHNYEISELWTSVYFYDRKNLINDLQGKKELCLVLNKDEIPTELFSEIKPISLIVDDENGPLDFYFFKLK